MASKEIFAMRGRLRHSAHYVRRFSNIGPFKRVFITELSSVSLSFCSGTKEYFDGLPAAADAPLRSPTLRIDSARMPS
eukprot:8714647-Karenia_brevis.AAC.1